MIFCVFSLFNLSKRFYLNCSICVHIVEKTKRDNEIIVRVSFACVGWWRHSWASRAWRKQTTNQQLPSRGHYQLSLPHPPSPTRKSQTGNYCHSSLLVFLFCGYTAAFQNSKSTNLQNNNVPCLLKVFFSTARIIFAFASSARASTTKQQKAKTVSHQCCRTRTPCPVCEPATVASHSYSPPSPSHKWRLAFRPWANRTHIAAGR